MRPVTNPRNASVATSQLMRQASLFSAKHRSVPQAHLPNNAVNNIGLL
ncbi:MAG: hypothetical protein P8Z67_15780 [Gammaproteobacteria bacterium]